jgi:hypothetical protein
MAVIVRPKFSKSDITNKLKTEVKRIQDAILLNLQRIGEQFVADCRNNDTYKDRTANLRSSIGYVILYNGKQLHENFESKGGDKGEQTAKDVIDDIKKKFPLGFVLIGVAGMDYAAAVEAKGFDVITASSQQAEISLKAAIERIKRKTQ